jgi:HEAT repeat protein
MSFASALVAPDEQARIVALRGLQAADMACADIADGVRAALSSPVVRVRCAALRRWARIGDSVDESIRQSLLHRERAVRLCALVAVVRCGGENAADAARYALHDSHPNVVLVALRAIWVRRLLVDPAAIVVLVQHADWRVRAQAMVALARLAPAESLHYLTETLAHGELTEQRALVRCLGRHQVAGAAARSSPRRWRRWANCAIRRRCGRCCRFYAAVIHSSGALPRLPSSPWVTRRLRRRYAVPSPIPV